MNCRKLIWMKPCFNTFTHHCFHLVSVSSAERGIDTTVKDIHSRVTMMRLCNSLCICNLDTAESFSLYNGFFFFPFYALMWISKTAISAGLTRAGYRHYNPMTTPCRPLSTHQKKRNSKWGILSWICNEGMPTTDSPLITLTQLVRALRSQETPSPTSIRATMS